MVRDNSGNLFGTSSQGGASGDGTLFEVATGSGTITTLASFNGTNGAAPLGDLVRDANGNLFGTTSQGGASGDGTVFEVAAGSGAVTTLAAFNGTNGSVPQSTLVEDGSGNLFGTSSQGGASGDGTVFEVAAGSGAVTTLATFSGTNGADPYGALVQDASGNLFGTTNAGGASGDGTVFEVVAGSGAITTLATFNGTNGANPYGALVRGASGNLFGTTNAGGASGDGTVFEVAAGSGTVTTLAAFTGANGQGPQGGLVEDGSGNLFGTTNAGGASGWGTIFEVKAGSDAITTLASFTFANGASPDVDLVADSNGNLFGTASQGGAHGIGAVFEVAAGSGSITTLASFNSTAGVNPDGNLVVDGSGDLFGTAVNGGASNAGTVFEVAAGSGAVTTLATFIGTNGAKPHALIEDGSGNLIGTTAPFTGTVNGDGTIFQLAAGSSAVTTLASFNGTNGADPSGDLVRDASGNLFGITYAGGASKDGTVFEVAAGSGSVTTLATFNGSNGANPGAGLIEDANGNLFGATEHGGASNDGTVFEVAAGSGTVTTLAAFNGSNGANPDAGLIEDGTGDLFGTTYAGGDSGAGTVFEVTAGSGTITTLATFNGSNGAKPLGDLVRDASGNLFGTTNAGGASNDGTVFEVAAGSNTITALATFNGANGANPGAGLIRDGYGNLFGTTFNGGAHGAGTVFELPATPATPTNLTTVAGNSQVSLSWTASPGAISYDVYRGTSAGGENPTPIATSVTGTRFTDNGLTNGTAYFYEVAAVNVNVQSGLSSEASATPLPWQKTIGVFDLSTGNWYLRNSNSSGAPDISPFGYGAPGWYPIVGDWNGDGVTTIGVVDLSTETWYLRNFNSPGAPSYTPFQYGAPGWIPVAGDWTGTGHTGIGVFDPSSGTWYLRTEVGPGGPDAGQFQYGGAHWNPVVGDWTGQGKDTIGVVDPSSETWYLRNSNSGGAPDFAPFGYGAPGWSVVAGDWTGTGHSGIGVFDPSSGTWYLRSEVGGGAPDAGQFQYGGSYWAPVAGDWDLPALPQLAKGGEAAVPSGAAPLTEGQLQSEVQAALNLLAADGVNKGLLAQLGSLQFSVGQLPAGTLGLSDVAAGQVEISADAAGYGWFVDANPSDSVPANRMDLLTVVLHEMGHFNGWTELDPTTNPDALMALTLAPSERRILALDAVFAAGL